jgi:hypothetical protein
MMTQSSSRCNPDVPLHSPAVGGNGGSAVIIVTEFYKRGIEQPWGAVPGVPSGDDNHQIDEVDLKREA